jgi:hypothetical protein
MLKLEIKSPPRIVGSLIFLIPSSICVHPVYLRLNFSYSTAQSFSRQPITEVGVSKLADDF